MVWNMGAIARWGGREAVEQFREVLTASTSVPAAFLPVIIPVESGGRRFTEMHVDGSTTSPFFTVPESLLLWQAPTGQQMKGRLSVILNAQVRPGFRVTPDAPILVAKDALLTLNNAFARTALAATEAFCRRNGLTFRLATLPTTAVTDGMMNFHSVAIKRLFAQGEAASREGRAFAPSLGEIAWTAPLSLRASHLHPPPSRRPLALGVEFSAVVRRA